MYKNSFLLNCMLQPLLSLTTANYQIYQENALFPITFSTFQGTSTPCLWLPNTCYTLICNLTKSYLLDLPSTNAPKELSFEKNYHYFCITFFPSVLPSDILKTTLSDLLSSSLFPIQISSLIPLFTVSYLQFPPLFMQHILSTFTATVSASNHSLSIQQLAQDLSYSERHIRRLFESYIGYPPKTFFRILRFQSSLQEILKMPDRTNSEFINLLAYSDQAHFQREFKTFTTMTPRHFIQFLQKLQYWS